MALSDKKRQKKQEQKKLKRKQKVRQKTGSPAKSNKADKYAHYPIHEALVQENIFINGFGSMLVSRKTSDGQIAASLFLVDAYCLGIKNAAFKVLEENVYETQIKQDMFAMEEGDFLEINPACAKKLITGAENYAQSLGFSPHRDYHQAKLLLASLDESDCAEEYTFGKDGKPLYVRGPSESMARAEEIVEQLDKVCGQGGFDYILVESPY
jgi:hypothetical protein